MEAIVLAGGFGTRLQSVVSDVPKPMAPINGKPFLDYVLNFLHKQGINRVVISTGYMHEYIEGFYGSRYKDLILAYSVEDVPLGTGGAVRKSVV